MENHSGVLPFAPGELEAWLRYFKATISGWRAAAPCSWCDRSDKQTLYPEFLPGSIRKVTVRTRLDDFTAAMKAESNVCVLDLRSPLQAAKGRHSEVYHRTDTHWSAAGVYAAYREILPQIEKKYPAVRPLPYIEPLRGGDYRAGDLAKMLDLGRSGKNFRRSLRHRWCGTKCRKEMCTCGDQVRGLSPSLCSGTRSVVFG